VTFVRAHVWTFAVSAIAAAAGSILAAYLVNNVRAVRNAVGPL